MIYNPTVCNINHVYIDGSIILGAGNANYVETLNNLEATVYLYEEDEDGRFSYTIDASDLNFDFTNFDINRVGRQLIPFTYQIAGQTQAYSDYLTVNVQANLTGATEVGTYAVDPASMYMFSISQR